jgi:hypothetical protein
LRFFDLPRTDAQNAAAERDGPWCLHQGELREAHDAHHLARRQPGSDVPELIVHLNHGVHMRHHNGFAPTTAQLLDLMLECYGWDLRATYPRFFGGT